MNRIDDEQSRRDFARYWPLKLLTLLWFVAALCLGIYLIAATWNRWWPANELPLHDFEAARPAVYAFASGLLGASLYALRGFYWSVGPQSSTNLRYRYDPNWTWWYIARPFMGAVLGAFSFALLRTSVATLGAAPSPDETSNLAYSAIAFLAGFSVTEFLAWMTKAAQRVFGVEEDAAPAVQPASVDATSGTLPANGNADAQLDSERVSAPPAVRS